MDQLVKIEIFDYITRKVIEIEVTQEVAICYKRTGWNIDDNDDSFRAHQTCYSELIGGEDGSYENFDEFKRKAVNPLELIDEAIEEAEKEERMARLPEAINSLIPEQKELVQQIFFEGVSESEYARKKGVSQAAVSKQLKRALKNLKKFFS